MFRDARAAQIYTSLSPSGRIQQLVWPHIVSGRSVPARQYTVFPCSGARHAGNGSSTLSLIATYSCGPTPSPLSRSWSMHGWPSASEKIDGRLPKAITSAARSFSNCQRTNES